MADSKFLSADESITKQKSDSTLNNPHHALTEAERLEIINVAHKGGVLEEKIVELLADELGKDAEGYIHGLEWSEEEEKRVVWLLDSRLMPFILFSTFILNMDRTNISNAISDNLPANLGFDINTVNNAGSVYAVVFAFTTFLGAYSAKVFTPYRTIPILMFAWGIVTLAHASIHDRVGFYFVRVFIALTEGGVIPATLIYLGQFYKTRELATRLSWFWGVQSLASAVSGLMASGILLMSGIGGLFGWKWLFIIDGIITIIAAVALYFIFPASPFRFGVLTKKQAEIAVTRVVRDDPVKRFYEQHIQWSDVISALTDSRLWGHLIITIVGLTPLTPIATYLPTIIRSFGFNVYVSNALTAPGYILGFISMTTMTYHSDKSHDRGWHGAFSATWYLVGFIILRSLPDDTNKYALWCALLFISSWPFTHPLNISWMTENMAPLGKRTVASGAVIWAANIYAVYSNQIYQAKDGPRFHTGNLINIAFAGTAVLLWIGQRYYLKSINAAREAKWSALSQSERDEYNKTTKDAGNDRLDFRFTI